jgi:hypothetical protein
MSNEVLTAIVVINAIVTLSLWRMMATKASRPAGLNKKAAKALWHSDPIVPSGMRAWRPVASCRASPSTGSAGV